MQRLKSAFRKQSLAPPITQLAAKPSSTHRRMIQGLVASVLIVGSYATCQRAPERLPPTSSIAYPFAVQTPQQGSIAASVGMDENSVTQSSPKEDTADSAIDASQQVPKKSHRTFIGPRGGHYHFSASGKKVYEKHD